MPDAPSVVLHVQALYYIVTGLWPLASMPSFEAITGPKTDHWLVYTVGLLLSVIGATLLAFGTTGRIDAPARVLSFGTVLAFVAIETTFVARRRIRAVYLLDAAVQSLLALALAIAITVASR